MSGDEFFTGKHFSSTYPLKCISDVVDDWARNWGQNRGRNACLSSVSFSRPLEKSVSPPISFNLSVSVWRFSWGLSSCPSWSFFPVCSPSLHFRSLSCTLMVPLPSLLSLPVPLSVSLLLSGFLPISLSLSCLSAPSLSSSLTVCLSLSLSPAPPPPHHTHTHTHTHYAVSQAQRSLSSTSPCFADADMKVTCSRVWANPAGTAFFPRGRESLLSLGICPFTNRKTVSLVQDWRK